MYLILWEFLVISGKEKVFEQEYGPEGCWVRFFGQGEGYRGTELVRDVANPRRYVTLDLWESRAAYDLFREERREEYLALDKSCEVLTEKEALLGNFEASKESVASFNF